MTIAVFAALLGGFALLVAGAEFLVRGASNLAIIVGLSPLIIGLTVVSYGTSAPDLAVGLQSYLIGQGDIALGNIIGSNIFNIAGILGMTAIVEDVTVNDNYLKIDLWLLLIISLVLVFFVRFFRKLGRFIGMILLLSYISYIIYQYSLI